MLYFKTSCCQTPTKTFVHQEKEFKKNSLLLSLISNGSPDVQLTTVQFSAFGIRCCLEDWPHCALTPLLPMPRRIACWVKLGPGTCVSEVGCPCCKDEVVWSGLGWTVGWSCSFWGKQAWLLQCEPFSGEVTKQTNNVGLLNTMRLLQWFSHTLLSRRTVTGAKPQSHYHELHKMGTAVLALPEKELRGLVALRNSLGLHWNADKWPVLRTQNKHAEGKKQFLFSKKKLPGDETC